MKAVGGIMLRSKVTLIDVVTLAVILAMLIAPGVPVVVVNSREYAHNVICATHLKQIGQAILAYTKDNAGHYPRTRADADPKSWTAYTQPYSADPFASDGPAPNDVTAALFLLLRTQDLGPELFVCSIPRKVKPWNFGGGTRKAKDCANFPGGDVLGYSYANPYPSDAARQKGYKLTSSLSAEFPVMADINPGTPELLSTGTMASVEAMKRVNSPNHFRGYFQNVLYGDGHVELLQTPFVGVQRDNIYTYGKFGKDHGGDGIIGSPMDANDSVLLPVATVDVGAPRYPPGQAPTWPIYAVLVLVIVLLVGFVKLLRWWFGRRAAPAT